MLNQIIIIFWIIFIVVWFILGLDIKKASKEKNKNLGPTIRLAILFTSVSLLFNLKALQPLAAYHIPSAPFIQALGAFICAGGIAFAIWARIHLGRNWGMPQSLKEDPDLVTTGPYSFIRHPIYTGLSFAMLGSLIAVGSIPWLLWFLLSFPYYIYSATKEEKIMLIEFPEKYTAYMKRTKMLIPFIF